MRSRCALTTSAADTSPDAMQPTSAVAGPVGDTGMDGGEMRRAERGEEPEIPPPHGGGGYQSSFAPNRMMVGPMIVTGKR
jgi:hypothetical protein